MTRETKRNPMTGAAGRRVRAGPDPRVKYGDTNVVVTDLFRWLDLAEAGPFELVDVTDAKAVDAIIGKYGIDTVYHLAALLSATGEKNPQKAWQRQHVPWLLYHRLPSALWLATALGSSPQLHRLFFGPDHAPRNGRPRTRSSGRRRCTASPRSPGSSSVTTMFKKYGLDVRGCRYPGTSINHLTLPGGGTTDYAVAIFYEAVAHGRYTCFLREDTRLPMMYMPDCLKCTARSHGRGLRPAEAPLRVQRHGHELLRQVSLRLDGIRKPTRPGSEVRYEPDFRQAIADSWPASIDDIAARAEWDWKPDYDWPR